MKSLMPNNLGKKFVVEECQKLSVKNYLERFRLTLKQEILDSVVEVAKQKIELETTKTGFGGTRHWFKCPSCKRRIGVLLVHPLSHRVGCRACLGLEYRKRRYKGMIENQ